MVYINTTEQFALILKIVNVSFFVILAFAILRQKRDYILNKMYFSAFLCWVVYIGVDAFVFIFLPVSSTFHIIGNRLRDFGVVAVLGMAFLIYKSYEIIKGGQDSVNKTRLYIEIAVFTAIAVTLVLVDSVQVYVRSTGELISPQDLPPLGTDFMVQPDVGILTLILSAIPLVLLVYTIIMLLLLTRKVDGRLKLRMILLTIGIAFVPLGMVYFILVSMFEIYAWYITAIGYTLWTIAPVLIWSSQRKPKNEE